MLSSAPTRVRLDELVRTTANYSPWFEGAAATATRVGVHGFRFDAHDQPSGVTLDNFHVLVCLRGCASIRRSMADVVEDMTLGAGDVLVNPMSTPLRWSWSGSVEVLNVTVHPGYLDELVRESMGATTMTPRVAPHTHDPRLANLAVDLHDELAAPDRIGTARGVRAACDRIAVHLLRHYADVRREPTERTFTADERRTLVEYVDERLDQSLRIRRLAALVHMGEHHFARTFRASFGVAPHTWLRDRRLERARQLVVGTPASLSSIAMATGFADQSHLTRSFGARYGTTPAVLRRACGA